MDTGPEISAPASDGSVIVEGVRLTHPDRVLYPEQGITKLALARYYAAIRDWVLPELRNRPLSLVRCPEGEGKACFYQKHVGAGIPDAVGRVEIAEKSATAHLFRHRGSRRADRDGADRGARTPSLGIDGRQARNPGPDHFRSRPRYRAALGTCDRGGDRDARGAASASDSGAFRRPPAARACTSSCRSRRSSDWDAVREFSKWVAERFAASDPDRFTTNMAKRARTGRIFIDYLRNSRGATAIAAYSPRARPGAPVATPLSWEEVENGVKPDRFTVATVPERLARLGSDPWAEMRSCASRSARRCAATPGFDRSYAGLAPLALREGERPSARNAGT